jgi:hypothetical protein
MDIRKRIKTVENLEKTPTLLTVEWVFLFSTARDFLREWFLRAVGCDLV